MDAATSPLLTDLYQLAMTQAYLEQDQTETAVFELFFRRLPARRNFIVSAGLEQALDFLENLAFAPEEIAWLASTGKFNDKALDYFAKLRFTGDVHAIPEGCVFFPDEPIIRITAPLPQAQLVESRLINILHFQSMVASKAARFMLAASGKVMVDFGMRRAHGAEAGLAAARSSYIVGFAGTATVLAGMRYGIPTFGTMAHSYIQAHDDEATAFEHFARARPQNITLLIDTYDTEAAARKVVALAPKLKADGIRIGAVRIDSGDLVVLAKSVRGILDDGGCKDITIFVSGGLSEDDVAKMLAAGAPIDGFGIGTAMTTSADAPALDCAYKLEEYAGVARRKRSTGKLTWPGRKQVWRRFGADGRMAGDTLTIEGDRQDGEALIVPVMANGRRIGPKPSLDDIRARARRDMARLPEPLRRLDTHTTFPVEVAPALTKLADDVDRRLGVK